MSPAPRWKRLAIPVWNFAIHRARAFGEIASAIVAGRFERCSCCGRMGPTILRPRSIPDRLIERWELTTRVASALVRKETLLCVHCGAKLRARRLASVLIDRYPVGGSRPRSVREWSRRPEPRSLRVAEINLIEGLHEALADLPHLRASDFWDGEGKPQALPSENLTRLTYANTSFDLVLTSETLEHVPDLDRALSEIHRVLRPGGWHLFTIPLKPGVTKTFTRSELDPDGSLIELATSIRHPGGDWGYPVFTEFGSDIVEIVDRAGFETTVHFGPTTEDDLAQVYASRKR